MVLKPLQGFVSLETLGAAASGADFFQTDGVAFGTPCRILFSASSFAIAKGFRDKVSDWVVSYESRYSRFREDSIICRINAMAGVAPVEIDSELISIFKLCDWLHWTTRGLFDPTMLPLLQLWDYHTETPDIPAPEAVAAARERVSWKSVQREENRVFLPEKGMALDIGGIGKEYAVDRVIEMAQAVGIQNAMVDFGHDVRVIGSPPEGGAWRIGIEDPRAPGRCVTGVAVSGLAVASSGNYARGFSVGEKRYGHILDPRSGYPSDNAALSTSIVAPTCTEAGVMATAALILGPDEFGRFVGGANHTEGCMMTQRGLRRTPGFVQYELTSETVVVP